MASGRVDVGLGAFLESKTAVLEGSDDLSAGLGRDNDIVRKVGRDEEYGAI